METANFLEQMPKQNKSWFKGQFLIIPLAVILIGSGIFAAQSFLKSNGQVQGEKIVNAAKQVKTMVLGVDGNGQANIETVGTVKADSKVDVMAMVNGAVRGIYFKTGDTVSAQQILVSLYDSTLLTSLSNAQTGASNMQLSYDSNQRALEENIRQAELGIKRAQESVESAKIGRQTAQDNFTNSQNLQEKNKEDIKNNAVNAYHSYLNTVTSAFDQINYILAVENNGLQLPGINNTLGARDTQSVNNAKNIYISVQANFSKLENNAVTGENILSTTSEVVNLLGQLKSLVDATIVVLNNTGTSSSFPDAMLLAQKNSFFSMRSNVINMQTAAQATLNSLQNIELANKQQLDSLQNAVNIAQSQLKLAQTGYDTAVAALDSARTGKEQALAGSKAALDSARGQLNVIQTQTADLLVQAPISGVVTQKSVELGSEVRAGQKLAEISQSGAVKIVVGISSEDIYKMQLGRKVVINDSLEGIITRIDPSADATTKKVTVEITYDNKNEKLIAETFVNVKISVNGEQGISNNSFFIPLQAVAITPNEKFVFIIKDNKAVKVVVELGITEGEKIEVKNGLKNGDEVIIEGNKELGEGNLVEVIK